MTKISFSYGDVEACFDRQDFERGRGYWRKGAVQDLVVDKGGHHLNARVHGSRPKPYRVTINVTAGRPLKSGALARPRIDSKCSCPVAVNCKHAVAVCLESLSHQQSRLVGKNSGPAKNRDDKLSRDQKIEAIISSLPPHIRATIKHRPPSSSMSDDAFDQWLESLKRAEAVAAETAAPRESILYILDVGEDLNTTPPQKNMTIAAVIASAGADGSFSGSRKIAAHMLGQSQARFMTEDDKIIGKLMQDSAHFAGDEFKSPPGDPEIFDLLMRRVIATGRCFLQTPESKPLVLAEHKTAKLGWNVEVDGSQVPAIIVQGDKGNHVVLTAAHPWYVDSKTRQTGPLTFQTPLSMVRRFLAGPKLQPSAVATMAKKMASHAIPGVIEAPRSIRIENRGPTVPVPCLRLTSHMVKASAWENQKGVDRLHNIALLHYEYDGIVIDPTNAPDVVRRNEGDRVIAIPRDRIAETDFMRRLTGVAGLSPTTIRPADAPSHRFAFTFADHLAERMQWLDFMQREVPALEKEGWRIDLDPAFSKRFIAIEVEDNDKIWDGDLKEQEGGAWWFSLDLGIVVEGQRVPLLPLLVSALRRLPEPSTAAIESLARSGKLYVDLPDGRALALPFERVRDMLTTLVELYDQPLNADGTMTVSLDLATALSHIDTVTKLRWMGGERLKKLIERLKSFQGLAKIPTPPDLKATLRPYQREGLNWLQFLRDYNLGGILADDMGLGKTIQALAHILTEKDAGRLDRPCLIVCPTSLIPNWQDEAAKFAPNLKVLTLHGKSRAVRFADIGKADLVLTTYPLLPRDSEILLATEWHMAVLDEAQAIKNPATKATQLVCELKARHRLCLTGTPIENHLGEAWAHFAFLMPGMLGRHKDFTKRFRIPIEKHKDLERQALLARRLKPFILRRNKSEVAKELPPKTEIIHHVEFDSAQRDLYETVRLTMHEKVQEAVASKGFSRSRIVILDALLKLRQICCDPRLVKLSGAQKAKHSAKLESLMEMLPEMIEEGRKILLFSQFTSMLDLIKPELEKLNIPFVEIRGDTTDRKTPVARFQKGEVPLFLISLKAGGTGINLTAADTVIHYDPWWNPAVENQATDRAHRIGQDKKVFVYKFIAKGTVEERIIELQNRKRGLASALMDERPDATAAFEANDLEFLFKESD